MKLNTSKYSFGLSVRNKLYVSFIAIGLFTVLTGGIGYQQVKSARMERDALSQLYEIRELGSDVTKTAFELSACVDDYVSYDEGAQMLRSRVTSNNGDLDDKISEINRILDDLGDSEYDKLSSDMESQTNAWISEAFLWMDTYDDVSISGSENTAEIKLGLNEYEAAFSNFIEKMDEFDVYAIQTIQESEAKAEASTARATITIMGVASASLVLAIVLGIVISSDLSNTLGKLVMDVGAVAKGDLGHKFEVRDRNDEIGEVISAIKEMVTNTAYIVASVQKAADKVVSMSKEFSRMAQETNESMDLVTTSTQQISEGAGQLSTLLQESSQNANRLSVVLQETGANSAKAGESIQQIMTAMQTTASTVENMDRSMEEIGSLANIVTDVANQTQLLALNAAIEAARAGEAGRGFAVVADAVRELSEQTNQAAADTLNSVAEVQKNGKDAIEVAQGSTTEAAAGVNVVNETITGVNQGVTAIEAVVKAIEEIASIAEESASSAEMNTAATKEQTAAMSELADNATNLEEIAAQLQAEMEKFQL